MTLFQPEEGLTDRHRAILDLERAWFRIPSAKEPVIREQFDLSPVRYYQVLNWLLDQPAAIAYAPDVVRRLRDQRDRTSAARRHSRASTPR